MTTKTKTKSTKSTRSGLLKSKQPSAATAIPSPGGKPRAQKIILWVSANRGVTSAIAKRLTSTGTKVTPQFVHLVLHGQRKSTDGIVERALRAAGAPI